MFQPKSERRQWRNTFYNFFLYLVYFSFWSSWIESTLLSKNLFGTEAPSVANDVLQPCDDLKQPISILEFTYFLVFQGETNNLVFTYYPCLRVTVVTVLQQTTNPQAWQAKALLLSREICQDLQCFYVSWHLDPRVNQFFVRTNKSTIRAFGIDV